MFATLTTIAAIVIFLGWRSWRNYRLPLERDGITFNGLRAGNRTHQEIARLCGFWSQDRILIMGEASLDVILHGRTTSASWCFDHTANMGQCDYAPAVRLEFGSSRERLAALRRVSSPEGLLVAEGYELLRYVDPDYGSNEAVLKVI